MATMKVPVCAGMEGNMLIFLRLGDRLLFYQVVSDLNSGDAAAGMAVPTSTTVVLKLLPAL